MNIIAIQTDKCHSHLKALWITLMHVFGIVSRREKIAVNNEALFRCVDYIIISKRKCVPHDTENKIIEFDSSF